MTSPTFCCVDWPAYERAKVPARARNPCGMPYLDVLDPVEFAADQAQKQAQRSGAQYEGVEQGVSAVAAWSSLSDAQLAPLLSPRDYSEEEKRVLESLPRPLVYAIAARAARSAFRAGVEHGMAINAPLKEPVGAPAAVRKKTKR